jgi:hypothetical protein
VRIERDFFERQLWESCQYQEPVSSLKNAGEVVLAAFFIGERDFDLMGVDLSGRNFAKTIAKDSGGPPFTVISELTFL